MKKSILILAMPCLMALTLTAGKVFATSEPAGVGVTMHHGVGSGGNVKCEAADQVCYEVRLGGEKIKEVLGLAVITL